MPASVRFRLKTRLLITLLLLSTVLLVQNVRSVPLSSQSLMKAPKAMNLSGSMAEYANSTSTTVPNGPIPADWPSWRAQIASIPTPGAGCFAASYPSIAWQATKCVTAPSIPLGPTPATVGGATSTTVGNGNDEVAQAPTGTVIGSSIGSFVVSGLTSETDSVYGANNYGLQVNSEFFTTSTTYTGGKTTLGWEQFVWINWTPTNPVGFGYIQYWLLGYQTQYGSCPSTDPPLGSSWMVYQGSCYANSLGFTTPLEAATNLPLLTLEGFSNYSGSGNDMDMLCITGVGCNSVTITDQVVNLSPNWEFSEFNVFGVGNGSQANFNTGTTITVTNTLKDQGAHVLVPSCTNTGYTGETNNLNLGSCTPNAVNGQIVFTESNVLTVTFNTNPTSFVGSSPPGSISACSSSFTNGESSQNCGAGFTATANPPSSPAGWQFNHWTWTGGVTCTPPNTSNPITCTVTSDGSLTATFQAQVTFHIGSALTVIGWGACAGSNEADGAMVYFTNFGTVSACYVPIGYSVLSWVCSSGLSCGGSSDVTPVSFTGPGTITLTLQPGSIPSPAQTSITATPSTLTPMHGSMFTVSGTLTLVSTGAGIGSEPIVCVCSVGARASSP